MSDEKPPDPPETPPASPPASKPPKLHIVKSAGKKRQAKGSKKPSAEPTQPVQEGASKPKKQGGNVRCAPEGMRCAMMVKRREGEPTRCTRYTVKRGDGTRAAYCVSHDDTPSSRAIVKESAAKGGAATAEIHSPEFKELERKVGSRPMLTQDDIAAERQRIMYQLAMKIIPAAAGNALLNALQQQSNHIEMFGGKQGVEGGAGYLRLLPGVKLIEQLDDRNRPLTSEEMKLIYERQAIDVKKGKKPPVGWADCILLYLGLDRENEVAYNEKQEPIGEYKCELVKDAHTGEKSVIRTYVPYKSRDLIKKRLEDEKAQTDRIRGK